MTASNRITRVAIVGASGNIGTYITNSLLATGTHTITALTRHDSTSSNAFPPSISVAKINYDDPSTLVAALKGQDALIITLSGAAAKDTETKLVTAAAEAGVPFILPSDFTPDTANEELVRDVFVFRPRVAVREKIREIGKSSVISVITGFWYEYCLSLPSAFGFDFKEMKVTFFDEGEAKVSLSTFEQVGKVVAALLSLPVKSDRREGGSACLEDFRDKMVYVNSFTVSQRDIFDSVLRVTGTNESDWSVSKELAKERYASGMEEIKEGKRIGFAKMLFTRLFFDDGYGDFEKARGTQNLVLGIEKEDDNLDAATERAIERSKTPHWST